MAKDQSEVVLWEPFGTMTPLREAMNLLLEDSFVGLARHDPLLGRTILVDVFESESEYTIDATLPGVKPEDVKVSATSDTITIRAAIKREARDTQEGAYVRRERREGEITRSIMLASPIDPERISAHYEHGALRLTAAKAEPIKPREIEIKIQ